MKKTINIVYLETLFNNADLKFTIVGSKSSKTAPVKFSKSPAAHM